MLSSGHRRSSRRREIINHRRESLFLCLSSAAAVSPRQRDNDHGAGTNNVVLCRSLINFDYSARRQQQQTTLSTSGARCPHGRWAHLPADSRAAAATRHAGAARDAYQVRVATNKCLRATQSNPIESDRIRTKRIRSDRIGPNQAEGSNPAAEAA